MCCHQTASALITAGYELSRHYASSLAHKPVINTSGCLTPLAPDRKTSVWSNASHRVRPGIITPTSDSGLRLVSDSFQKMPFRIWRYQHVARRTTARGNDYVANEFITLQRCGLTQQFRPTLIATPAAVFLSNNGRH